jgi:hypothetical protein
LVYDAVERCLERISEAARKLGEEAEALCPGPPWPLIRGWEVPFAMSTTVWNRPASGIPSRIISRHSDKLLREWWPACASGRDTRTTLEFAHSMTGIVVAPATVILSAIPWQ